MKFKTSASLMIAVVLGLVTAYVGIDILKKAKNASPTSAKVVVAARDMEPGYVVQEKDLELEAVPASLVPDSALKEIKLVAGRTILATVVKGYPLLDNQLSKAGDGSGMQAMIPRGMRAFAVETSEGSAAAGLITPGSYVDVYATLRKGDQPIAMAVVRKAKVQFVQRSRATRSSTSSAAPGSPDALGPIKTVTLLVTPKQVSTLELAQSQGKLKLVLRGVGEEGADEDAAVTQNEMMGIPDEPPPAPVVIEKPVTDAFADPPPAPKKRTVEYIRAGEREIVEVDDDGEESELTEEEGNSGATPAAARHERPKQPQNGNSRKSAGEGGGNSRTASGASPDSQAPRNREAGSGNLRRGM